MLKLVQTGPLAVLGQPKNQRSFVLCGAPAPRYSQVLEHNLKQDQRLVLIIGYTLDYRSSWKIDETPFDARHLINHLQRADQYDGDEVIDHLLRLGLGNQPHPQRLEVLRALLRNTGNRIDNDRLIACLTIITAMPEYQLC